MMYPVLIPCRNDKTELRWEPGDFLHDGEVSEDVIENWLEIGVLGPPVPAGDMDEEE